MFSRNSRYYGLTESSRPDRGGEQARGTDVRVIPRVTGGFTHTVREGDRLDLLAYRYYGDPARWWRISDANPQAEFPTDLLDGRPHVTERFALSTATFVAHFGQLLKDLGGLLRTLDRSAQTRSLESLDGADAGQLAALKKNPVLLYGPPDFQQTVVMLVYPPSAATREKIFGVFKKNRSHVLRVECWPEAAQVAESFLLADEKVKASWQKLTRELANTPGVVHLRARAVEATLEVTYNSLVVAPAAITEKIKSRGFQYESSTTARVGAQITIPGDRAG